MVCQRLQNRKKRLVEVFHTNGLSIPYDRVMEISAKMGDAIVSKYIRDGVVPPPPELRRGLFINSAMENIDNSLLPHQQHHSTVLVYCRSSIPLVRIREKLRRNKSSQGKKSMIFQSPKQPAHVVDKSPLLK